ncbi:MAG: 2-amino-4-hydroxy-6-hydroxymethyldihydropteridine diphosphokinase [Alphaproteobacteria bacterium]|jgi:2-amino-4-hydroxy-6-hydroxymethyldihydropteridine diphosphokinase|nr:2-amino-4-hydroxy-6-hydroxymethyldihydropteridine diphosphokinase [Alphaproteobacteria bacterium]
MILIGLGGNLPSPEYGASVQVIAAALGHLQDNGVRIGACSSWYQSAPIPASDQPWFVNGVARIETALAPPALLALLHRVEARLGRRRERVREGGRWAARIIDLDLLAYDARVIGDDGKGALVLPHPRMCERAFVLAPLAELAPLWRHPASGKTAAELLAALPPGQQLRKMID